MRSFCSAKAPHIFSAKNISTLDFRPTRRLNESLTNDFVKLTMLWTTGPWHLGMQCTANAVNFNIKTIVFWILKHMSPVKRICVVEHSVMTNFNCACPAIQRGQGSGFLSEDSSWLTACLSEQRRFWRDCADAQARLNLRCSHRR